MRTIPLPASRPPLARMMRIHEALQDGRLTTCRKLAALLEVSTKTIMRDLAFMRDQLGLPTEYDVGTQSWRYAYPVKNFPTVQMSEGELLALLVARKALEQYRGTPYHDQLARAFDKLSGALKERISFSPSGMLTNISFHQAGLARADLQLFEKLARAVNESFEISFEYRKPPGTKGEQRRVQPYHLANRENVWYLIGYDIERQALRNYALGRMKALVVTERRFVRPADFSPEKYFGKAFGAFVGTGDHRVIIRFSPVVANQVRERFWHESQEIRELAGGGIELTLQVGGLDEIQRWILGWAEHAEVIAPDELKEIVHTRAEATVRQYQAPGLQREGRGD
jgi:predicted DNA-binding transcriptional regulator YafY